MEGRSGCAMEIIQNGHHAFIRKYSSKLSYNARLVKQAKKQQHFFENNRQQYFQTPPVHTIFPGNDNELAWFEMDFAFAEKYSDHLEKLSIEEVHRLFDTFINYFEHLLAACTVTHADQSLIYKKISELGERIPDNAHVEPAYTRSMIGWLEQHIPAGKIPLGPCHGDFTLSNMLFAKNTIYLVDFLDSFIESPVIDIVKLRQDTTYRWSVMLEKDLPQHRVNKLTQILDHIDSRLDRYCNTNPYIQPWYSYLQVFNLLRILPYLHNREETCFVQHCLTNLLN
jgi:hypothetical protein